MKTLRIAKTLVAMAAVAACMGAWADRRWTGGGETADWGDSGNWDGGSGAHVFRHSKQGFTKKALSFSSLVGFSQALWLQNNEASFGDTDPIVFSATSSENGLNSTSTLNVGPNADGDGYLKIESGTHSFSGKSEVGGGGSNGKIEVSGGTLNLANIDLGMKSGSTGTFLLSDNGCVNGTSWFCAGRPNGRVVPFDLES